MKQQKISVIILQKNFKMVIEMKRLENKKKMKQLLELQENCSTSIQRLWRGYKFRSQHPKLMKEIHDCKRIAEKKIKEKELLDQKSRTSIHIILTSDKLSLLMQACVNLDYTTTHSNDSCDSIVREGAVSALISVIQLLNRSPPHLQVLIHILNIVINLSKRTYTDSLVNENIVPIILDQLVSHKDEDIIMRCLKILNLLSNDIKRIYLSKDIKSISHKIEQILKMNENKYKTEKKRLLINKKKGENNNLLIRSESVVNCHEEMLKFWKKLQ